MKTNNTSYDQAYLQKRRAELQAEMQKTRESIALQASLLFTPAPATTKMQHWVQQAERAVAVYDGVMTGYKLFQKFRSVFVGKKGRRVRSK